MPDGKCIDCRKLRLCAMPDGSLGVCLGHELLENIKNKEELCDDALAAIAELKEEIAKLKGP